MDPSAYAGPDLVNSTFNCVVDGCASTGYCATEVGLCSCQTNYLGQDCSIFAYAQTESTWIYFMFQIIFFSLVFLAILVWAIVEIGLMVKNANGNVKDINRYTLMIYSIIGFLGLVRVLYLAMYQYGYIQVIPEMVGNILLGLGVTLYLYIQFSIMYIWIDAYLHAKPQRREFITVVQKRLIFVMILTFLVQFVRDVIISLPQYIPEPSRYGYQIFYFCYLFVIGITTGVFLLYFGYKVRKQLKQFQDVDKDRKRVIRKMTSLAIMSSIAVILVTIIVVGFVIVLAVRDQNDEFTIAADFIERAVEASYCLVVLGVYRRRVLAPNSSSSHKSKTQQSSATGTVELKSDSSLQNIPNVSP